MTPDAIQRQELDEERGPALALRTRVRGGGADHQPDNDRVAPGTCAGEYVIERHLADGGTATVYEATHPLIGKRAAIKVLSWAFARSEPAIRRFVSEARAVNQIRHPNIVDIFAFGKLADGRHYLAMERLEGETLFEKLSRGRLPLVEIIDVLGQICDALDAAHAHHIAHLDLKPENIFLVPMRGGSTLVKLLDFGIAKLVSAEQGESGGDFCGTPDYASPEQARGLGTLDHRSDIYSLGVLAYELIVGQRPFEACSPIAMLWKHLSSVPPRPSTLNPSVPQALEQLMLAMLAKDPADRPTMTDVRQTLVGAYPAAKTLVASSVASALRTNASPSLQLDRALVIPRRPLMKWAAALTFGVLASGAMAVSAYRTPVAHVPVIEPSVTSGPPRTALPPSTEVPRVVPAAIRSAHSPMGRRPTAHSRISPQQPIDIVAPSAPPTPSAPGDDYLLDSAGRPR